MTGTVGSADELGDEGRGVAVYFAELSRELQGSPEDVTLDRIARQSLEVIPAADHCGISLRRRRHRIETGAATSALADECDALQYQLGEGPCVEAIWDSESFLSNDTSDEPRWPRWSPVVARKGIGSVLSLRLATSMGTLGAINLYAEPRHAFTDEDIDLALIFAAHATNAMNSARLVDGLQEAVQSRHLIGVAQGILMHRYGLTLEHSFEVLRRYSSHRNVKLRDLATMVVETGGLPEVEQSTGQSTGQSS